MLVGYNGIHMGRKNIKLPADEYEKHNERRQELGLTWAEYIDGQTTELETMIRRIVREELNRHEQESEDE